MIVVCPAGPVPNLIDVSFISAQIMSCFVAANSSISLGFLLSFQYIYYILAVMIEPPMRLGIRHSRYSEGNGAQKIG